MTSYMFMRETPETALKRDIEVSLMYIERKLKVRRCPVVVLLLLLLL